MDPARPNDPDPADPFNPERADHAVLEKIEIATEGDDCVRKLRPVLKKIAGVKGVKVDVKHERVIVTFDARKTHAPDLHDAILKSGYEPGPTAD
jgi:copper chaperone CopZ